MNAELPGALTARALGADVEIPDHGARREAFDEWLCTPPPKATRDDVILTAFGLR